MNSYILVDFCERDARTKRFPSVGLAQAHPNNNYIPEQIFEQIECFAAALNSV